MEFIMVNQHGFYKKLLNLSWVILLSGSLTSCGFDVDNNLSGVPATGLYAAVGANQHASEDSVQIAAAIFVDGDPINLYGGDVIQASTTTDSTLLLDFGYFKGSYSSDLPNGANLDQVDFLIVHKPIEARQDRWYPVDHLYTDPGPGELVGSSASIILPPGLSMTNPIAGSSYSSVNDSLSINWTALGAGDVMKVYSAVSCNDGANIKTYGTQVTLVDEADDGVESVTLNKFIYDLNDISSSVDLIEGQARAILVAILKKLSSGAINDEFFASITPVNPATSNCEIRLFLFRQRPGSFNSPSTNGVIFGSRSAEVTINYNPVN
jgi:hypothetical protein